MIPRNKKAGNRRAFKQENIVPDVIQLESFSGRDHKTNIMTTTKSIEKQLAAVKAEISRLYAMGSPDLEVIGIYQKRANSLIDKLIVVNYEEHFYFVSIEEIQIQKN